MLTTFSVYLFDFFMRLKPSHVAGKGSYGIMKYDPLVPFGGEAHLNGPDVVQCIWDQRFKLWEPFGVLVTHKFMNDICVRGWGVLEICQTSVTLIYV